MNMKVYVEQVDGSTFRASTACPIALTCEGESREKAIDGLAMLAGQKLSDGELVDVEIPEVAGQHPWAEFAGIWRDHPDFQDYARSAEEYRRTTERRV